MKEVWIVGRVHDENEVAWSFQGAFDSEDKAVSHCFDDQCFVGPAVINEALPVEDVIWPGAYYPKAEGKVNDSLIRI